MRYEIDTIIRATAISPRSSIALDLGCGTGRDAFVLARHFDQVYGYDFSPDMIRVATRTKLTQQYGNVSFDVRDIEDELLPATNESVALVNTAFGMGSFVRDLPSLFREVRRVLLPRGIAVFSFYNSESLSARLNLAWTPALAARVLPDQDELHVKFGDSEYRIAAKAYSVVEIERLLRQNFSIVELTNFPKLSELFPQTLFDDERARQLCTNVDTILAANKEVAAGPYIVAVCRKSGHPMKDRVVMGYERVLQVLDIHKIAPDIKEHAPARTMIEVQGVLEAPESSMVKRLIPLAPQRSASCR